MMREAEFDANIFVITEIATIAERMAGAGRTSTTMTELAERLRRPLSEIIRVFELLGLQPRAWSDPSSYLLSDMIEAATRHEMAHRG